MTHPDSPLAAGAVAGPRTHAAQKLGGAVTLAGAAVMFVFLWTSFGRPATLGPLHVPVLGAHEQSWGFRALTGGAVLWLVPMGLWLLRTPSPAPGTPAAVPRIVRMLVGFWFTIAASSLILLLLASLDVPMAARLMGLPSPPIREPSWVFGVVQIAGAAYLLRLAVVLFRAPGPGAERP